MALTFITSTDAIREVAKCMGLTNGTNMTPYSDDLVASYIMQANELIRGEHEWDEVMRSVIRTTDGVTGKITQLIPACTDWKLIRRIYQAGFQTPLPRMTTYTNPLTSSLLLGYYGLAPADDAPGTNGKYLVQFQPLTLVVQVLFQIEQVLDLTDPDAVIPIDFWLHVWYAAWLWACEDGTNPLQVDKYNKLMTKRMKQITARENSRPSFNNPNQLIPNEWWEQDAPYA